MNSVSTYFKPSFTGKIRSRNKNNVPCQEQSRLVFLPETAQYDYLSKDLLTCN